MIRALIVDDEPLARLAIRTLVAQQPDFAILGEAATVEEAAGLFVALRPDLVFLDVAMPGADGFALIEAIRPAAPAIVFVTAFDSHAVRAFAVEAVDYLLKPFDDKGFARVAARVRRHLVRADDQGMLIARCDGIRQLVPLAQIDWIGTVDGYAEVHAAGRTLLLDESLASLAGRLPARFARVHRAAIVPLDRLQRLRLNAHGDGTAILVCGTRVRVSRRYRQVIDIFLEAGMASDF